MEKEIKNPCINRCKYDKDDVCKGCDRTKKEITNWNSYSEKKKIEVMREVINRTTFFDNSMDHYI